jgi:hypothetical protein
MRGIVSWDEGLGKRCVGPEVTQPQFRGSRRHLRWRIDSIAVSEEKEMSLYRR